MCLVSGLCGFTKFQHFGLNVDYVNFLISTIHYMDYLWLLWIFIQCQFLKSIQWYGFNVASCGFNNIYKSRSIETTIQRRNKQILWQKIICSQRMVFLLLNPLAMKCIYLKNLSCYYFLLAFKTFHLVIKDCEPDNEPTF